MNINKSILGMRVDVTSIAKAVTKIKALIEDGRGHYICVSTVHMCMESYDDNTFQKIVNNADFVVPDGRPLVWAQYLLGARDAKQTRGIDLMLALCEVASALRLPIGFYGTTQKKLAKLRYIMKMRFPGIKITNTIAPPFRLLTSDENDEYINMINKSGTRILFVGIGCPKQERWMAENKFKLNCVMIGVGAAFDFIIGSKRQAPRWIQYLGFEWFYRLISEPKRLWRRYLIHNPRFILYFITQLIKTKISS